MSIENEEVFRKEVPRGKFKVSLSPRGRRALFLSYFLNVMFLALAISLSWFKQDWAGNLIVLNAVFFGLVTFILWLGRLCESDEAKEESFAEYRRERLLGNIPRVWGAKQISVSYGLIIAAAGYITCSVFWFFWVFTAWAMESERRKRLHQEIWDATKEGCFAEYVQKHRGDKELGTVSMTISRD